MQTPHTHGRGRNQTPNPGGNTNSVFALDYISGSLTVNGRLDRENPLYASGFSLTVKATELNEDRTPSLATVLTTFTILLIDKNDNAPKFNSSEYRVRITELAQVGFALPLSIQVEDKDEKRSDVGELVKAVRCSAEKTLSPGVHVDVTVRRITYLVHPFMAMQFAKANQFL
ncbi:hypothetical protein QTP86_000847 [Hemibagrus guttatus]|nr:hypothetical protein QTP86_000847 [Hemibagrus guttatus]